MPAAVRICRAEPVLSACDQVSTGCNRRRHGAGLHPHSDEVRNVAPAVPSAWRRGLCLAPGRGRHA
ncbi:hypothetical protein P3T35_005548 [Kitasatospora sp. GP30]|nr:hypothetical protein [Kitasatospora sp. GP30]